MARNSSALHHRKLMPEVYLGDPNTPPFRARSGMEAEITFTLFYRTCIIGRYGSSGEECRREGLAAAGAGFGDQVLRLGSEDRFSGSIEKASPADG